MILENGKRAILVMVGLALLALLVPVGFLVFVRRHVPTEPELRAYFTANREGFSCFRRELSPNAEGELLVAAKACGLGSVVAVRRWESSREWRLVMVEKPRFIAVNGFYERGFALDGGGPLRKDEQIVTALGEGKPRGHRFLPLEDGWSLYEAGL
jgi:hypothetical protein